MTVPTPNYGWPIPTEAASTELWTHFGNLGNAADASLKAQANRVTELESGGAWVTVPVGSAWEAVAGYPVQVRKVGALVELRGMVHWRTAQFATSTICTISASFRPAASIALGARKMSASDCVAEPLLAASNGIVNIPSASWYTGTPVTNSFISLNSVWLAL